MVLCLRNLCWRMWSWILQDQRRQCDGEWLIERPLYIYLLNSVLFGLQTFGYDQIWWTFLLNFFKLPSFYILIHFYSENTYSTQQMLSSIQTQILICNIMNLEHYKFCIFLWSKMTKSNSTLLIFEAPGIENSNYEIESWIT